MWYETKDYLYYDNFETWKKQVLFIDLDGTLITTKSARLAYRILSGDDWIFLGDVPEKLAEMATDYSIIILSNQRALTSAIRDKINQLQKILPYRFLILRSNEWRKPSTKCLSLLDLPSVKFTVCGDAIGDNSNYPPYSWSDADYQFYLNLPGDKIFIPPLELFPHTTLPRKGAKREAIIMMGPDGESRRQVVNHFHQLGYSSGGNLIIYDGSHPNHQSRQKIINQIPDNYQIRIVWCLRDDRAYGYWTDEEYNRYSSLFEEPIEDERVIIRLYY